MKPLRLVCSPAQARPAAPAAVCSDPWSPVSYFCDTKVICLIVPHLSPIYCGQIECSKGKLQPRVPGPSNIFPPRFEIEQLSCTLLFSRPALALGFSVFPLISKSPTHRKTLLHLGDIRHFGNQNCVTAHGTSFVYVYFLKVKIKIISRICIT